MLGARLRQAQRNQAQAMALRLDVLRSELVSGRPDLAGLRARYQEFASRLDNAGRGYLETRRQRLGALCAHLEHLNPQAVLSRGYSIVTRSDGVIVRDSKELEIGAPVDLTLARGRATARVEKVQSENKD